MESLGRAQRLLRSPFFFRLPARVGPSVSDWAPSLLLLCVLGYEAAFLAWRAFVPSALIVLAAPLLLVWRLPRRVDSDHLRSLALGLMAAIALYTVVGALWLTPLRDVG